MCAECIKKKLCYASFKLPSLCLEIISKNISSPTVFLSHTEQAYNKLKQNMPACQIWNMIKVSN